MKEQVFRGQILSPTNHVSQSTEENYTLTAGSENHPFLMHSCVKCSRGRRVSAAVYLFGYPLDISKTDAARITKLDIQMFHDESWKWQNVKSRVNRRGSLHSRECWLFLVFSVKTT